MFSILLYKKVKKMRRAKSAIFLTFLFVFSQFFSSVSEAGGPTVVTGEITAETTWTKSGSPYVVMGQVVVKAPLTIEAGTVVKLGKGGSLDSLKIQSDFFVNGTREEPVVFTAYKDDEYGGDTNGDGTKTKPAVGNWLQITFNPSKDYELKMNHAKIFYANFGVSFYPSTSQTKEMSVKNSEIRKNGIGIVGGNAEVLIEKNVISENANYGISVSPSTKTAKAINNSIAGNGTGARGTNSANPGQIALDAKYNWWGDISGPQNAGNPDGKGNSAVGQVSFDPWIKEDPLTFPDPAIIIPGIMGSWEKNGVWQIDPIFHTYDNLYEEFKNSGYIPEKNLFTFPYQWRDSNKVNAVNLRAKIQEIRSKTNRPKVDIVAHSMGGLLAREYIESSYYENDVDQLITVGTPHLGAPEAYMKWEGGAWLYNLYEIAQKSIVDQEAREKGFDDAYSYIRNRPIISIKELLPSYNYLYDAEDGNLLRNSYPVNYPQNNFLDNLNKGVNISVLKKIEFTKIIGKTNENESTINGYNVVNSNINDFWEYGIPKDFLNPFFFENGLVYSEGDETVPLFSAEANSVPANDSITSLSKHNDLPTISQKDVIEILTDVRPASEVRKWLIDDILLGMVFSPVDMQIISPSGKKLGKNFDTSEEYNEIEGAYYSGFDNDTEFFTIPNPEDGEYKILTEGTGTGEYEVEIVKISENDSDSGNAEESAVTIEGNAKPQVQEETTVRVEGGQVEKLTIAEPQNDPNPENGSNQGEAAGSLNVVNSPGNQTAFRSQTNIQKLDDLKGKVRAYFLSGQIKTRKEARVMTQKLNHIRIHLKKYETETSLKKIKNYRTKANGDIIRLIRYINQKTSKAISGEIKNSLIEDLNNLKID
jgi:pimeloyl-ACP methyl ester carboxylesterase